ncbi:MAG: response regulator [Pseudomonadales bacterium]|nr:response regulator [Pseudomonadales bacterium]
MSGRSSAEAFAEPGNYAGALLTGVLGVGLSIALFLSMDGEHVRFGALVVGLFLTGWTCFTLFRVQQREQARRHEVEEALRNSEARYRLLAENASDVIYMHDLDWTCTYISPSVSAQRGFEPEEMLGEDITKDLTPESRAYTQELMREALKYASVRPDLVRGARTLLLEAYCKDGSIITIENHLSLVFDEDGVPCGVLGVSRDISDRTRAEQEKRELETRYRQVQKMEAIGTLAGGVAHDFNNLLTGILGYTDLLKMESQDEKVISGVAVIERAARRAQELTSQLLGFARKGQFQSVPVDIGESIRDIVSFLERTINKNIVIDVRIETGACSTLRGDPSQVHQLLLNLAVNARDAMPDGGQLSFETHLVDLEPDYCRPLGIEPGSYNLIIVSDTGVGISREKQERIFEPFFTDKGPGRGTGMGLAMVYGVAKAHGGAVSVYSELGAGTTFRVYLPYSAFEGVVSLERKVEPLIHGSGHILVVDDEEILRNLSSEMLAELGYTVTTVADGVEAVRYFERNASQVDLAIIDMIMPNMGGTECMAALRRIDPGIRAVMSTGFARDEVAKRIEDANVVGFLQKPYGMRELSQVVAEAMDLRPAAMQ